MSKEPIDLMPVNIDQIVVSDTFNHYNDGVIILLVTKKVKLINYYPLFYLK